MGDGNSSLGLEFWISSISLVLSFGSAVTALIALGLSRGQAWAESLSRISDRLETAEMRTIRHDIVYTHRLKEPATGPRAEVVTETERLAIDRWGAEMDVLAALFLSGTVDKVRFFETYGDVILRAGWQLAPYGNGERAHRGNQFWLPFQDLVLAHLELWQIRIRKGRYPESIALRGSKESISVSRMFEDGEVRRFLEANGRRVRV